MKTAENSEIGINMQKISPEVQVLIPDLMDDSTLKRQDARHKLENMGEPILEDLYHLLHAKNHQLRWEAAKTLEDIASEKSIPELIKLMHNSESEFRWMAAEGLRKIGRKSIVPVLKLVENSGQSPHIRTGAHHILNALLTDVEKLEHKNLMESLNNYYETGETAPVWASSAIKYFKGSSEKKTKV